MVDVYSVVLIQADRRDVSHRKLIKETNLNRALALIDNAAPRLGFPFYAPTKLVVFPEVFMQGWHLQDPSPYKIWWEKVAKDIAIEIPGEETELLAQKAKQYNTYIAGTAHEVIPEIGDDVPLNCAFIISPKGEVVYKYHKFNTGVSSIWLDDISPHDLGERYIKVMDGKYGRKKGDIVSCFFPVLETDIGKLGFQICADLIYVENARAFGMQGCELMIQSSGMIEPHGQPPQQQWELCNRSAAMFNMMYVAGCAPGDYIMDNHPKNTTPGQSMVVDYEGSLIQHVTYPGETATAAVVNVDMLRRRRADPKFNKLASLRTEIYREMYKPRYPANLYEKGGIPKTLKERQDKLPLQRLFEERIFIRPA